MQLEIYDPAGSTVGFWYETGDWRHVSNDARRLVQRSEVASGPFKGKRIVQEWTGLFDERTGEAIEVRRLEVFVAGKLHLSIRFEGGFRNVEEDWVAAYANGFAYRGNRFANVLTGGDGDDRLFGGDGADVLESYKGDDLLDGGKGRDVMRGGEGDDVYIVDHRRDTVIENDLDGQDQVRATVSFTLPQAVEALALLGKANLRGAGNELANFIRGNSGDNTLAGLFGDDRIEGGGGDDTLFGGEGADRLSGGVGRDRLDGGDGDDQIFGGRGSDALHGGAGADLLDGGAGRDEMVGGAGDDTYVIDRSGERVFEAPGAGWDLVRASVSFRLPENVEGLQLLGGEDLDGWGNGGDNRLTGNGGGNTLRGLGGFDELHGKGGADRLIGGAGDDRMYGGSGRDRLVGGEGYDEMTGGANADVFAFVPARGATGYLFTAAIEDFERGRDKIDLTAIDADVTTRGDQGFDFIGADSFSGEAGELRFGDGRLQGDVNGDGSHDFEIQLRAFATLREGDLLL